MAFNEYHVAQSALATEKSLFLLLSLVAVFAFVRFVREQGARDLYLCSGTLGLAFLCNEFALVLGFAMVLALPLAGRAAWFKGRHLYLASLLFLALISLDIRWNVLRLGEPYKHTYAEHLTRVGGIGLSHHPLLFYLRSAVRPLAWQMGWEFPDPAPEYPSMNPLWGVGLLAAVLWATLRRGRLDVTQTTFLVLFWVVFGVFVLLRPGEGLPDADPVAWFWVDPTLLFAAVLGGRALASLRGRRRQVLGLLVAAAVGLACLATVRDRLGLAPRDEVADPGGPPGGFCEILAGRTDPPTAAER